MPIPRSTVLRLTVPLILSLALCALAFLGIGWLVRSRPEWIYHTIGIARYHHLFEFYEHITAFLAPGDRDGDGVCDGAEFLARTGMDTNWSHYPLGLHQEAGGIIVFRRVPMTDGESGKSIPMPNNLWGEEGERVRGTFFVDHSTALRTMPRGFRVRVRASPPLLMGVPGDRLDNKDLLLPVDEHGSFAFEAQIGPVEGLPESRLELNIPVSNAATSEFIADIVFRRVWKGLAFVPRAESTPDDSGIRGERYVLKWAPRLDSKEHLLVEVARAEAQGEWSPVAHPLPGTDTSCVLDRLLSNSLQTYAGPIKFRVVPVRDRP